MDIRLIFDTKDQIRRPIILHNHCRFQNIPVFLDRFRFIHITHVTVRFKQNTKFRWIQLCQFFRIYDIPSAINQIVTGIRKYRILSHIIFCYYICVSHIKPPFYAGDFFMYILTCIYCSTTVPPLQATALFSHIGANEYNQILRTNPSTYRHASSLCCFSIFD